MELLCLNEELDINLEHEIISKNEFGFDVLIVYTEDSWYPFKKYKLNNCTEVHWRFTDIFNPEPTTRVAFESDIHKSGFNREISTIKSIIITLSEKEEEEFIVKL